MGAAFLLLGLSILLGASYPKSDEPIAIVEPEVKVVHFPVDDAAPAKTDAIEKTKLEVRAEPARDKTWATALWHATR